MYVLKELYKPLTSNVLQSVLLTNQGEKTTKLVGSPDITLCG